LARAGAFDGLGTIPAILKRLGSGWMAGQMSLFSLTEMTGEDWSIEQKMAAQQELLGISLEAHPLELLAEQIAKAGAITIAEAAERIGQRVTVAGVRQTSRRSRTARGEMMMFLSVEDLSGVLNVILFPDIYRLTRETVYANHPFLITGTMEIEASSTEPYLRAERVERLE
jgi:DNA polymerase III alpha subunit